MRISDWSSDVCSSDLPLLRRAQLAQVPVHGKFAQRHKFQMSQLAQIVVGDVITRARCHCRDGVLRHEAWTQQHDRQIGCQAPAQIDDVAQRRSEEHTSELQSLMRTSYAVFSLKKKKQTKTK